MFNIIEKQIKLNMKTETREERTLETPMVADGMRQGLFFPWDARHKSSSSPTGTAKGPLCGGMNMVQHKVCICDELGGEW